MYIGIMSGTSLDGIDLVAADFDQGHAYLRHQVMYPFPAALKEKLISLSQGTPITLEEFGTIDHFLGKTYAESVNRFLAETQVDKADITAIGCHGQTVFHKPSGPMPFTMQLGDTNLIAALTGITTVADFRRKDMAFGGQGAPLTPAFHRFLFHSAHATRVVLNIGGIANISVLQPGKPVVGYDTGPGNMLMDGWVGAHRGEPFDRDGAWAAAGTANPDLLAQLLSHEYFARRPPKSTGRECFHKRWLDEQLAAFGKRVPPQHVQATLLALTVGSIADQVRRYPAGELVVCGGGARNNALMNALAEALPQWAVRTTDELGVNSDSLEALAFAWLARQTLAGLPGNLPEVTGASTLCKLGAVYYPD